MKTELFRDELSDQGVTENLHRLIYDNLELLIQCVLNRDFRQLNMTDLTLANFLTKHIFAGLMNLGQGKKVPEFTNLDSSSVVFVRNICDGLWSDMQLCQLAEKLKNNEEFVTINSNLKNSGINDQYRLEKLYSIYRDIYGAEISKIRSLYKPNVHVYRFGVCQIFWDAVSYYQFMDSFDKNRNMFNAIFEKYGVSGVYEHHNDYDFSGIVKRLDNPQMRGHLISEHGFDDINAHLLSTFAKYISANYDVQRLLRLILDTPKMKQALDERQRIYETDIERKRLLSGDLAYEERLVAEQAALENVQDGISFEKYLVNVFTRLGYRASETKASGDSGADLVLERNDIKYVVQAKFHAKPIGNKAIQEVYSAKDIYKASVASVITNNAFTKQAMKDGAALGVILINGDKLKAIGDALAKGIFIDVFK